MAPPRYTIASWREPRRSGRISPYQMRSHLAPAWRPRSQPGRQIPQMMACHSKLSSVTTGRPGLQAPPNIGFFLAAEHTHTLPPPPPPPPQPLPPACVILPTANRCKIIRWLADILSIFLSWLRVRLAGCSPIDVRTEFFVFHRSSAPVSPDCKRARGGRRTGEERRAR